MAKRGRKPKQATSEVHQELEMLQARTERATQKLYTDLAVIKDALQRAFNHLGTIESSDNLAEAAFKAGRAFNPIDRINDKLEEMLDELYEDNDFDHWEDIVKD